MTKVKLVSQEGDLIEVLFCSILIPRLTKRLSLNPLLSETLSKVFFWQSVSIPIDAGTGDEIPLPNVKMSVLRKVLEYCEKYKNENPPEIEKPLKSTNLAEVVPEFDAKYIDIENLEEIFDIILAANYLDIKPLLDLSCAKIASLIKGKSWKIVIER